MTIEFDEPQTINNLIGTEIFFDTQKHHQANFFLNGKPLQNLQAVINEYNKLEILPPFTDATLANLAVDNGEDISNQYLKLSEKDLSKITNPVLRDNQLQLLQSALQPFKQAVSTLLGGMSDLSNLGGFHRLGSFSIVSGEPVLNVEYLRKKYTQTIENEKQATVYVLAQEAIEKLETLRRALTGTPFDPERCEWISTPQMHGIFENEPSGALALNPYLLERL